VLVASNESSSSCCSTASLWPVQRGVTEVLSPSPWAERVELGGSIKKRVEEKEAFIVVVVACESGDCDCEEK